MDERAAQILSDLGGDADGFVARHLEPRMVAEGSLVLTATREHRAAAVRLHPPAMRHTFTILELAALLGAVDTASLTLDPTGRIAGLAQLAREGRGRLAGQGLESIDIVDPFRRPDDVYELMREQIAPAIDIIRAALTPGTEHAGGRPG